MKHSQVLLGLFLTLALGWVASAQRPLGIDVSSYQGGSINWNSVRTSGVSFAWCKATEGVTFKDSTFGINITNARAAGVLVGAYHYARPDNNLGPAGAAREATNFWNSVSNYIKADGTYLLPVLDIEADLTGVSPAYTKATLSQWVNAWCSNIVGRAAEIGVPLRPVVYTYVSYSSTWLDSSVTNWPLWMAQYPASPNPQSGSPSGTSPWPSWNVWQYSSTGTVPGVSGNCDQNVFNGTQAGLRGLVIGGDGPPVFVSEPSDRYVDPGSTLTFTAAADGKTPLRYQWRFNGANLPLATNSSLVLANVQPANAGGYTVVVTNLAGSITSRVATLTVNPPYVSVFADNFDTNSSASWLLSRSSTDNRATFAYDYSALGIPAAPNSGGTSKGLRLEANLTAGSVNALNVSPIGQAFPTNSRLRFDMWINVNGPLPDGGTGSTEAITAGVGTAGGRVQWNGAGSTADGTWFAITGEGGSGDTSTTQGDFVAYRGTNQMAAASGVYAAGTETNARGNGNGYYQNVFPGGQTPPALQQINYPQQTGALAPGTVGLKWREVIVARAGDRVEWFIDGLKLATLTNVALTASNIFVGYWDPYPSLSDNTNLSFGLVDNLRVEVPAAAPALAVQPVAQWVRLGSNALLVAAATGLPSPNYQWRLNGTNLAGATNASLVLASVQAANAGQYSVVVTNVAGSQTSSNALLTLIAGNSPSLALAGTPGSGGVELTATVELGATYALETSTNLITWTTLTNFIANNTMFVFTPNVVAAEPQRYYRLRSGP